MSMMKRWRKRNTSNVITTFLEKLVPKCVAVTTPQEGKIVFELSVIPSVDIEYDDTRPDKDHYLFQEDKDNLSSNVLVPALGILRNDLILLIENIDTTLEGIQDDRKEN